MVRLAEAIGWESGVSNSPGETCVTLLNAGVARGHTVDPVNTLTTSCIPQQRVYGGAPTRDAFLASYQDPVSGCRLVVATPSEQPKLWRRYLQGAAESYRHHGVESVLEYDDVIDGRATTMFFAALDDANEVVGGMRVQGPYSVPHQAHAVSEWGGAEGTHELVHEIQARIAGGVIEMKTGWVRDDAPQRRAVTDAVARIFVHSLQLTGARYALGTVAQHAQHRWKTTGGQVSESICPVAYPDDRYRTVVMWWDREQIGDLAAVSQLPHLLQESAQIEQTLGHRTGLEGRVSV